MTHIERDQKTILMMIDIYCRHHLHLSETPEEYRRLGIYACNRLSHCRFGERKPACKDCPTHCYQKDMREKMRCVMRWSGPRMLFYLPGPTMRHLWQVLQHTIRKRT